MEYEIKYAFKPENDLYIRNHLEFLCKKDQQYYQNTIHSLYFDSASFKLAMEKASSDYLKTKVRVRWYTSKQTNESHSPRFLEIKAKIGSKRRKVRFKLPAEFDNLDQSGPNQNQTAYLMHKIQEISEDKATFDLEPAIYVSYDRSRYYEPYSNSRISLDTAIRCQGISNYSAVRNRQIWLDEWVLEAKGSEQHLPTILRGTLNGYVQKAAFSKYYESYKLLNFYEQ